MFARRPGRTIGLSNELGPGGGVATRKAGFDPRRGGEDGDYIASKDSLGSRSG